jgi:hypothetical protein
MERERERGGRSSFLGVAAAVGEEVAVGERRQRGADIGEAAARRRSQVYMEPERLAACTR